MKAGENFISVEVAGYNINGYGVTDQPSFLLAEVVINGKVVLATNDKTDESAFHAFQVNERVQKVERYSFQRAFTEYYRFRGGVPVGALLSGSPRPPDVNLAVFPSVKLLPRHVEMPTFELYEPVALYASGTIQRIKPERYAKDRSLTQINQQLKGYLERELEVRAPSQEIQEIVNAGQQIRNEPTPNKKPLSLKAGEFYTYEFNNNLTGFIGAKIKCITPTRLFFYFDEMLTDGDVKTRQRQEDICNQIVFELEPGNYNLETIEAYALKYLKIIALEGEFQLEKVYLRDFSRPDNPRATFQCSNEKLNKIYAAAKQSSRQNALDVFMDCPSRERAGWLCDAYFAAVMERDFTGESRVSDNFLENYALPEKFANLPEGMIPMCYPADHYDGNFIPQWSLWFLIELEDYARCGGDPLLISKLKPRVESLLHFFSQYENTDGLLEKLPAWNFVEWSRANSFTQDVSYPTNMLYSAALIRAGALYKNDSWREKAEKIKTQILKQSYNGEFFVDNAIRRDGKLAPTGNTTEVCQYYAFYFDIATPRTHSNLWKKLTTEFGPKRDPRKTYPRVFVANAFMGNYMRVDLLARYGVVQQEIGEVQDFFYPMAEKTGTLWEHMGNHASCNHGFASYMGHVLYRDALGIESIDYVKKEITLRIPDNGLDFCRGSLPLGGGVLEVRWQRGEGPVIPVVKAPVGFSVKILDSSPSASFRDR
jgi:alpha-L-rhamnosidase